MTAVTRGFLNGQQTQQRERKREREREIERERVRERERERETEGARFSHTEIFPHISPHNRGRKMRIRRASGLSTVVTCSQNSLYKRCDPPSSIEDVCV